jgi:hypothetical protein
MAETLRDSARADAAIVRAWLAHCGITADLELLPQAGEGRDYVLTLSKEGNGYQCLPFGLGSGWGHDPDRALVAGVQTLYPVLEPDGWDEGWEADVAAFTTDLRRWLAAVDADGRIEADISTLQDLEQPEYRQRAIDRLRA